MHRSTPVPHVAHFAIAAVLLLLVGCGAPPAPTATVRGTVFMGPNVPVAGVLVHAQGRLVTSDGEGRFVLDDIATPYTLTVASTGTPPWAQVFDGLTATAPVLALSLPNYPWAMPGAFRTARVTGATPNANPLPPGQRLEVCVAGLDAVVLGCDTVVAGADSYDLDARWWAAGDADVRLHALLLQVDADDRPTGVLGYGTLPLTLTANATLVRIAPSGPPPPAVAVQGTVAVAGGGVLQAVVAGVRVDDAALLRMYGGQPPSSTIGFVAPDVGPSGLQVLAVAQFPTGVGYAWALVDPSAPFDLALPAPPPQLAPVDGATGVTPTTSFTAVGDGDGVYQFAWQETGVGDGLTVRLLTRRTSVTLPDLAPVGLAWSAGGTYGWSVAAWSAADVDEAAALDAQGAGLQLLVTYGVGVDADGWIAGSGQREVTLAP